MLAAFFTFAGASQVMAQAQPNDTFGSDTSEYEIYGSEYYDTYGSDYDGIYGSEYDDPYDPYENYGSTLPVVGSPFETATNPYDPYAGYQDARGSPLGRRIVCILENNSSKPALSDKEPLLSNRGPLLQFGLGYAGYFIPAGYDDEPQGSAHAVGVDLSVGYRWNKVGFTFDVNAGTIFMSNYDISLHVSLLLAHQFDRIELWGKLGFGVGFLYLSFKSNLGVSYRIGEMVSIGADFTYYLMNAIFSRTVHKFALSPHVRLHF